MSGFMPSNRPDTKKQRLLNCNQILPVAQSIFLNRAGPANMKFYLLNDKHIKFRPWKNGAAIIAIPGLINSSMVSVKTTGISVDMLEGLLKTACGASLQMRSSGSGSLSATGAPPDQRENRRYGC